MKEGLEIVSVIPHPATWEQMYISSGLKGELKI